MSVRGLGGWEPAPLRARCWPPPPPPPPPHDAAATDNKAAVEKRPRQQQPKRTSVGQQQHTDGSSRQVLAAAGCCLIAQHYKLSHPRIRACAGCCSAALLTGRPRPLRAGAVAAGDSHSLIRLCPRLHGCVCWREQRYRCSVPGQAGVRAHQAPAVGHEELLRVQLLLVPARRQRRRTWPVRQGQQRVPLSAAVAAVGRLALSCTMRAQEARRPQQGAPELIYPLSFAIASWQVRT